MMSDSVPGSHPAYIAIDWGTTNRRVFLMAADGQVLRTERDGDGVMALAPEAYPDAVASIRTRFGQLPILAAGMIGSTRGWREAPYVSLPAGAEEIAAAIVRLREHDVAIVPGVKYQAEGRFDVMRGEEVQAIGAARAGLAPGDALFCQPGTHNKWIELVGGGIERFATSLTGEVFALLRDRSTLGEMMRGPVADGAPFRAGVRAIAERPAELLSLLFLVRASVLLGGRSAEDGAAFASGLLIGCDVVSRDLAGTTVHLLSDPVLGPLYAAAIAECGATSVHIDGLRAFANGIHTIWSRLP